MTPLALAAAATMLIFVGFAAGGSLRRMAREFADPPRRIIGIAGLAAVLYAAVAMPAATAGSGAIQDMEDIHFPSLFIGHAILATFLLAWWSLRKPVRFPRFLFLRDAGAADVAGGIGLGLRVWGVTLAVAVVAGLLVQFVADGLQLPATAGEEHIPEIPAVMMWMADLSIGRKLLIVLAAMTVEEAFFRAFLQSRIGLLPSSVLFAVAHASYGLPTLMLGVFVVSIVIGLDFARHRRLLRSIVAHGVFDAIQLIVVVPWALRHLQAAS